MHVIPKDDSQGGNKPIKFAEDQRIERNPVEMAEEAETYRQLFEKRNDMV